MPLRERSVDLAGPAARPRPRRSLTRGRGGAAEPAQAGSGPLAPEAGCVLKNMLPRDLPYARRENTSRKGGPDPRSDGQTCSPRPRESARGARTGVQAPGCRDRIIRGSWGNSHASGASGGNAEAKEGRKSRDSSSGDADDCCESEHSGPSSSSSGDSSDSDSDSG